MIYDDATKFESINYKTVIADDLKIMDMTAISMARENKLPLVIFDVNKPKTLFKILCGEKIGTRVIGSK